MTWNIGDKALVRLGSRLVNAEIVGFTSTLADLRYENGNRGRRPLGALTPLPQSVEQRHSLPSDALPPRLESLGDSPGSS